MSRLRNHLVVAIVLVVTVGPSGTAVTWAGDPFAGLHQKLEALAAKHLSAKADYQPDDLITRGDVEPILNELIQNNVPVSKDGEDAYGQLLRDSDPLVLLLRTAEGQKFMRKVSKIEGAYDRLERFAWLPEGQVVIQKLINDPKGVKIFAEMATPEGMKVVAKRLAADPRGQNFALPTGHIHTAAEFVAMLEQTILKQAKSKENARGR